MARISLQNAAAPRAFARARPRAVLFVAALVVSLVLAACGSSGQGTTGNASDTGNGATGSGNGGVTVAYSQCMRSHGVPNFPDPNSQGVIGGQASSGSGSGNQINPNSPQYITAAKACQKLASGGTTPAAQSHQLAQALKYTNCMRTHGVPNFPDPTVSNGQIKFSGAQGVGRTPGFQTAMSKCSSLLAGGGRS